MRKRSLTASVVAYMCAGFVSAALAGAAPAAGAKPGGAAPAAGAKPAGGAVKAAAPAKK